MNDFERDMGVIRFREEGGAFQGSKQSAEMEALVTGTITDELES